MSYGAASAIDETAAALVPEDDAGAADGGDNPSAGFHTFDVSALQRPGKSCAPTSSPPNSPSRWSRADRLSHSRSKPGLMAEQHKEGLRRGEMSGTGARAAAKCV